MIDYGEVSEPVGINIIWVVRRTFQDVSDYKEQEVEMNIGENKTNRMG